MAGLKQQCLKRLALGFGAVGAVLIVAVACGSEPAAGPGAPGDSTGSGGNGSLDAGQTASNSGASSSDPSQPATETGTGGGSIGQPNKR